MTDSFSLDEIRADGWFETLCGEAPVVQQIADVIGPRVLGFSVIAGIRITSLAVDQMNTGESKVGFGIEGSDEEHELALRDFRMRVCSAMVSAAEYPPLPKKPGPDDLRAVIGMRQVMLAALYHIELVELSRAEPLPNIKLKINDEVHILKLDEFRSVLREHVIQEARTNNSPFSIDLAVVDAAKDLFHKEDWNGVVNTLGSWAGPLSMLLRTAEGQQLSGPLKATLARALGMLATASAEMGQHDWAEEVFRLGVQWGHDGEAAGELFTQLGVSYMQRERYGEAIGVLRRALALGASGKDVLPHLAVAFAARQRFIAAAVCAEEALSLGVQNDGLADAHEKAMSQLGDAWDTFREEISVQSNKGTIPPPAPPA